MSGENLPPGFMDGTFLLCLHKAGDGALWGLLYKALIPSRELRLHDLIPSQGLHLLPWGLGCPQKHMNFWQDTSIQSGVWSQPA